MTDLIPLKDIIILLEHKKENGFDVSELYEAEVVSIGPDVTSCKEGDIIYFYQKNNRSIDDKYSFIFDEDVLFKKNIDKETK